MHIRNRNGFAQSRRLNQTTDHIAHKLPGSSGLHWLSTLNNVQRIMAFLVGERVDQLYLGIASAIVERPADPTMLLVVRLRPTACPHSIYPYITSHLIQQCSLFPIFLAHIFYFQCYPTFFSIRDQTYLASRTNEPWARLATRLHLACTGCDVSSL